jgi:hypothetical protein
LDIIDDETHDREHGIFTRCAIECEGLEGTSKSPLGSIYFASLFATGENYVIRKVKGGVKRLGYILSGGVGMNDIHVICLYALLGNRTFTVLLKNVFNLDMNGLVGDFLLTAAHKSKSNKQRGNKRSRVVDRKELENRVSNGDKLDTADEAKLSKLSAAHESKNNNDREKKRSKVVDRIELENRLSNGDKLDTADEAKLSKLSAAHESKKNKQRGKKRSKVVDRIELENRLSNGDKLDTADEAKLSKLSAAHEHNKKSDRERKRMQRKRLKTVVSTA